MWLQSYICFYDCTHWILCLFFIVRCVADEDLPRLPQLQASIIVLTNEVQASLILYSWHVTVISMSQLCSKFKFSQPYLLYAILWVYPSMTFIVAFYDMYLCLLWHCIEYKMMCIAAFYDLYGGLIWLHIASTYIFLRQFDSNSNV